MKLLTGQSRKRGFCAIVKRDTATSFGPADSGANGSHLAHDIAFSGSQVFLQRIRQGDQQYRPNCKLPRSLSMHANT
jgi:hypothetical protein